MDYNKSVSSKEEYNESESSDDILSLDDSDNDVTTDLYLKSSEGKVFKLKKKHAKISRLISTILSSDNSSGITEDNAIILSNVNEQCLGMIVEYMTHHEGKDEDVPAQTVRSNQFDKVVKDQWDATFMNKLITKIDNDELELKLLFEVIMAVNYMDMKTLLYKACAKVATQLKGKKLEDIPKILKSVSKHAEEDGEPPSVV